MENTKALLAFALLVVFTAGISAVTVIDGPSLRVTYLDEEVPEGSFVISVFGSDTDGRTFTFGLQSELHPTFFTIRTAGTAGIVEVDDPPDREMAPNGATFEITITDEDGVIQPGIVMVTVILIDINDNAPMWLNPPVGDTVTIREDSLPGTNVLVMSVQDLDVGENSIVRYNLLEPLDGTFEITELTGVMTLRGTLDFLGTQMYTIRVMLTDEGIDPMSTIVTFTVQVMDVTDPPPVFTQSPYSTSPLRESDYSTSNMFLVRTRAVVSSDLFARIEYSGGFPTLFEVRTVLDSGVYYGDVYAIGDVDYEAFARISFNVLAVRVSAGGTVLSFSGYSSLSVNVLDVDDNDPIFRSSHYTTTISESTPIGITVISTVDAFDFDSGPNAEFEYRIESLANPPFDIEPVSGEIFTIAGFEYDGPSALQEYNFEIYAVETDSGTTQSTGEATVTIFILDENDNSPAFAEVLYTFEVREEAAAGILTSTTPSGLTMIQASDADSGTNGEIDYTLLGPGVGTKFQVSTNGEIETLMPLDRDADIDQYFLSLIAEDRGSPTNRNSTILSIRVLDINDNPPVFNPDMYSLMLLEGETYPNFLTVVATDTDEAGEPNALFTYRIERDDPPNPADVSTQFIIDSSGRMSAMNLMHSPSGPNIYTLKVIATDMGTDPMVMSGTATVVVTIQDANLMSPVFMPAIYTATIDEDHMVNTATGITVSATDPEGHGIQYFIEHSLSDDSEFFAIDATSGVIFLAHELDYEAPQRTLQFNVIAVDDASPPLTSTVQVDVTVRDVNDNDPVITNPPESGPFIYNILEGPDADPDPATMVAVPNIFLLVTATDADGDSDGGLVYTLTSTPASPAYFILDPMVPGRIMQNMELDREMHASITLTVEVCDEGSPVPRCDSVNLVIQVADLNDNPPSFVGSPYTATRSESLSGGSAVITVTAEDMMDIGNNQVVEYSIISVLDSSLFIIEAATGVIRLAPGGIDLEAENRNAFNINVQATDNPGGTTRLSADTAASFTLTVEDYNDIPPEFVGSPYQFLTPEIPTASTTDMNVFTGVSSTDGDFSLANQDVRYELAVPRSTSTFGWLDIDSMGNIYIVSGEVVDREHGALNTDPQGRGLLTFDILAINEGPGTMPDLTATATVIVTITDMNDNDPVIVGPGTIDVIEHSPLGSILAVFSATDEDVGSNAEIEFSITSGDSSTFAIDANGVLTIEADVDEETDTSFSLTITASNPPATGGTPTSISVTVRIIETNDFNPEFEFDRYDVTIDEYNAVAGTGGTQRTIGTVTATDNDTITTAAGQLEYSITGGNERGIFAITDPTVGSVSVVLPEMVDYETDQQFDLIITATDTVMPINERRVGTTHFVVTVEDENDSSPQFLDTNYIGSVIEEADGATVIVVPSIRFTDPDTLRGAEEVTITITNQSPESAFIWNSDNNIETDRAIDREEFPAGFMLELTARDTASNTATTTVMITINDINDNPPEIIQTASDLDTGIQENFEVNDTILTITAQDDDISPNNVFTFSLSGDRGFFQINRDTGIITLIQSLDREMIPTYTLTVTTVDGASNSDSVSFTVTVRDFNDNEPRFTMQVFTGSVHEHVDNGTLLSLFINATDLDGDTIEYSIVTPGVPFGIIPNTGQLFTIGDTTVLDREIDNFYDFRVQADDGLLRTAITDVLVEITILDINDQNPVFTSEVYENDLFEGTQANVIILQVHANDNDTGSNTEIVYSINSVTPSSLETLFDIEATTGDISIVNDFTISAATPPNVTIEVRATDSGDSPRTDLVLVILQLIDRNTEAPEFDVPHYNCSVTEERDDEFVCTIRATESAADRVNVITYSVVTGFMSFTVDSTGAISTSVELDRELIDRYTLTVAAADLPPNGDASRTGIATVTVHVLDINDNEPYFDPEEYPIGISESTSVGSTVVPVLAFDDDIGINAELTFQIASGDTDAFEISNDGVITTKMELNRENVPLYELIVVAQDNGVPTMQGNASVIVHIIDENDNSPEFTNGSLMEVEVIEGDYLGITDGLFLTQAIADDIDEGFNQVLVYSFDDNMQVRGPFHLDRDTGTVTLRGAVDREEEDLYELTVTAADQRGTGPQVRRTTAMLRIRIVDINDNVPFFNTLTLEYSIAENLVPNLVFGRVEGGDRDIGQNAELFFHLLGNITNTTCYDVFCIDQRSGELYLNDAVDRETQDIYVVQMAVSNSPILTFNISSAPDAASTTTVTVRITDINDEPPEFISETLLAAVAEEAAFGTTVTTLRINDLDIGNGQVAEFEIVTPTLPFLVMLDTGVVTTSGIFRGASGTKYEAVVRATDNPGSTPRLSTTATMTVYVFKTVEQLIFTFGVPTTVINGKLDLIESTLAAVTSSRIIINEVRVFQTDRGGTVDITRSDAILFVLNEETGEVQQPEEIIRLIDQTYATVEVALRDCVLEEVKIHPEPISDGGGIPAYVWVIVSLLAALICCFCCCFLCIFVVEKRRYRRVKRKSQLDSYQSQLSNANAVSNPLWIAPYDNWDEASTTVDQSASQLDRDNPVYESQELTIEMFQDDDDIDVQSTASDRRLLRAPPLTTSTPGQRGGRQQAAYSGAYDDELLAEAIGEPKKGYDYDSETSLI